MNKGLTNAFYYMFSQILKANLRFASTLRDVKFLESAMLDPTMVQIIDMKAQVLDPALNQLKQTCMDSVIAYIQKLLDDFVTTFIVFVTVLTLAIVALGFTGFRVLRRSMWDTNILLKIIPFETLKKNDRLEIKNFFST